MLLCCSYSGARTQEGFLEFINKALEADKGFARVPSLDSLAASFSTAKDPKQVVADLTVSGLLLPSAL